MHFRCVNKKNPFGAVKHLDRFSEQLWFSNMDCFKNHFVAYTNLKSIPNYIVLNQYTEHLQLSQHRCNHFVKKLPFTLHIIYIANK